MIMLVCFVFNLEFSIKKVSLVLEKYLDFSSVDLTFIMDSEMKDLATGVVE